MKSNTTFIFAGIMSAIIGNAYATGENTVTSKSYVDAQDALKQDLIDTDMVTYTDKSGTHSFPALVSYDDTDGLIGTKYGIANNIDNIYEIIAQNLGSTIIPTVSFTKDWVDATAALKQYKIPQSGSVERYLNNQTNVYIYPSSWLENYVKGTALVTKTDEAGNVGERKIFEATDVANYHDSQLSANEQAIQDISIPTVGAMMTAISNGVNAAAPTGTPNTIANYGTNGELDSGIATYTGAAAYNATNDSAKIPTMAGVTTYAQAKKTCAGWPDGTTTYDTTHTDANCWLWTFPD